MKKLARVGRGDMRETWRANWFALWRRDRAPLLALGVVFLVMTYPFAQTMDHTLPGNEVDTHTALWQNWWLREALLGGLDTNHSQLLFHPTGLDVSLQPKRWTTFPLWTLLYSLVGDPLAFNLTASLGSIFKAYGMYLVGLLLFKRRLPALVAGAYFAFNFYNLRVALELPNTGATEWIPWFMLLFMRALFRLRAGAGWRAGAPVMLGAGICFSLNLYMNLKIGILAMLLGGGFALLYMTASGLWRARDCWLALLLFSSTALVICAPLLLHTLGNENFAAAAERPVRALAYFDLYWQWWQAGLASLGLALLGIAYIIRWRRGAWIWLALALVFNLLSMGIVFHFRGEPLPIYWTPYRLLEDNFFFRTLNYPERVYAIFVFAYSLLIGFGFCLLRRWLGERRWVSLSLILLAGLALYDSRIFPLVQRAEMQSDYVAALDELQPGALIDAPFGRQVSKYYMSLQRHHLRPIVEGMTARMPPDAYKYIDANPVLRQLSYSSRLYGKRRPVVGLNATQWQAGLDALVADGFRYLVLHDYVPSRGRPLSRERPADWVITLLAGQPAVYADDEVAIYDLLELDADALAAAA
ncbi:MAG: hypothetical protein OXE95_14585 [Chloroflexi bacterium]|nr:hypothetical protein [Chloroflexota bacterium]MCY4248796.1 hypothetical protein [Chloroflexota bacterium]